MKYLRNLAHTILQIKEANIWFKKKTIIEV